MTKLQVIRAELIPYCYLYKIEVRRRLRYQILNFGLANKNGFSFLFETSRLPYKQLMENPDIRDFFKLNRTIVNDSVQFALVKEEILNIKNNRVSNEKLLFEPFIVIALRRTADREPQLVVQPQPAVRHSLP